MHNVKQSDLLADFLRADIKEFCKNWYSILIWLGIIGRK